MGDWALPTLQSLYPDFLAQLKARDLDAITLGAFLVPVPIVGMIRYDRPANYFQEYIALNTWQTKVLSVAGGGTGASTPAGAIGALGLGTMATQNANNVAITGGSIGNLSALTVAGSPYFGANLSVQGNINTGGTLDINGFAIFRNSLNVLGQIDCNYLASAAGIQTSGPLSVTGLSTLNYVNVNGAGGLTTEYDIWVKRNLTVSGTSHFVGNVTFDSVVSIAGISAGDITGNIITGNRLVSNGSALIAGDLNVNVNFGVAGDIYTSVGKATTGGKWLTVAIGSGWTGTGTRVLLDNDTWADVKTVGGGVREVVHNNFSFGTDEAIKDIVVNWTGAQPAGPKNWHLQFDQPYQDQASGNGGTVFYNVTYLSANVARITRTLGPGAVPPLGPTGVVYTAFHHRTEV